MRSVREAACLGIVPGYPSTIAALPPVRKRLVGNETQWPGAEELVAQLVTLPTHSLLTASERDEVLHVLDRYGSSSD